MLQFEGDISELWRELDGDSSGYIQFSEISPDIGRVLEELRDRVSRKGDSAIELFDQFDGDKSGSLDEDEFREGCHRQGYDLPSTDLATLFHALDTDGSGLIHQGEMALLEDDPIERKKIEQRFRDGVDTDLHTLRARAKARMTPITRKPWQPYTASQLLEMRRSLQARKERLAKEAALEFHSHLLRTYGNIVRAWRRGLDPKCKMHCLNEMELD